MADRVVTVAIPVRNGGAVLEETLRAVVAQETDCALEILVADSGSTDGSVDVALAYGATIARVERFSHGGTRNELMARARGDHVAFLTQDATPTGPRWLAALLEGFGAAEDVGLVYGPYVARPDAPRPVVRELDRWFSSLSPGGGVRIDRDPAVRAPSAAAFFTDANGCVARAAWERVPFRSVPYAEDQMLAVDMLRAGYAKVFQPRAVVTHSHSYRPVRQFRRSFDEWRGLREVHGWVEPASPARLRGQLALDWRELRADHLPPASLVREMLRSARHWGVRWLGALTGSRADRIPPRIRGSLSLERRATFEPVPDANTNR